MLKNPLTKISHPFVIRVLERSGIQETCLNIIIKTIYSKSMANIWCWVCGSHCELETRQAASLLWTQSFELLCLCVPTHCCPSLVVLCLSVSHGPVSLKNSMNFPVSLLSLHSLHPAATSKFSPLLVLSGLSFTKLRTLCAPSSSALSTNEAGLELHQVYCQQQLRGGKESFLEVEADWEMFISTKPVH